MILCSSSGTSLRSSPICGRFSISSFACVRGSWRSRTQSLEDGHRGAPQVEVRVEFAAESLDREQRLLQQHELRLHFHVEAPRRLEQAEQHDAEGDVPERLVEDRLADRAHGRLELVDARVLRHPGGVDVQLRHAPVVALEERQEVLGQIHLVARAQAADDAEIDRHVEWVLGVGHVDEDVARMHVGVEEVVCGTPA